MPTHSLKIYSDSNGTNKFLRFATILCRVDSAGFDTRANLRREMEDRKRRFDDARDVRGKIAEALKHGPRNAALFDGVHIFTPHADIPDDGALRLVVLLPERWYAREDTMAIAPLIPEITVIRVD